MSTRKKFIIYDLDGTLVDTRADIACAANHMLREMGRPTLASEEVARSVGIGLQYLVKNLLQTEDPKLLEKGSKLYRSYYTAHMLDYSRLYPNVPEVLEYFKDRKQAVLTNKPNPYSKEILRALGVAGYFVEIAAGETDYPRKPDPTAVHVMMKKEKVRAEETLFIGDSEIDIATAKNAGVAVAVVSHGFSSADALQSAKPDILVRDFHELLTVAKEKGW